MRNFKLILSYDGSRYRGWQRQGNTGNTIQGKLEAALGRLLEQEIELNGSGRTDAGAHAEMQVASFRAETALTADEILKKLRAVLPEDIAALSLCDAPPRFHARLSCTGKTYIYRVWNSPCPDVFRRRYLWRIDEKLDIPAMRSATGRLLGSHDFSAFCSNKRMKKSAVRRIDRIDIEVLGSELRFTLSGDGFLYNMVRIIVGTLIEVGRGGMTADGVSFALSSLDRSFAGPTAPAQGLCLTEVKY